MTEIEKVRCPFCDSDAVFREQYQPVNWDDSPHPGVMYCADCDFELEQ